VGISSFKKGKGDGVVPTRGGEVGTFVSIQIKEIPILAKEKGENGG